MPAHLDNSAQHLRSGLHVLHTLHSFPPDSHGGTETYVQRLARAQHHAGLRVTILAGRDHGPATPMLREEQVAGHRVLRLRPASRRLAATTHNPDLHGHFAALLERERVDLLHVHHWHNVSGNLVAMAHAAGVPALVSLHDYFSVCPRFFRLRGTALCDPAVSHATCVDCLSHEIDASLATLDAGLANRAAVFRRELELAAVRLALSRDQRDELLRVPAIAGLDIDYVSLPAPDLEPLGTAPPTANSGLRVVTWGGLVEGKGLAVLLGACQRLEAPQRIAVHHYGRAIDAGYRMRLERAAGATALTLHGVFDELTMRRELPGYDLAVFPTYYRETYGYVVDEALALGLPVVLSDRGAPAERVGRRGVVFPAGDVERLAQILQELLDRPARLAAMRAAAPPAPLGIAEHWRQLAEHYARALG